MDYITHAPERELPASLNEVDAYSVYAAFEKITDSAVNAAFATR